MDVADIAATHTASPATRGKMFVIIGIPPARKTRLPDRPDR
jgi:hypothetical protein